MELPMFVAGRDSGEHGKSMSGKEKKLVWNICSVALVNTVRSKSVKFGFTARDEDFLVVVVPL